jgi:ribose transport system permease protein
MTVRGSALFASQEGIILAVTALLFAGFALLLPAFLTQGNLIALIRSISILGLLSLGMSVAVISKGVDVSMVATMVVSVAWVIVLNRGGMGLEWAILCGALLAMGVGALTGAIIAFGEVPPIFATLAIGSAIYGAGRTWLFDLEMQNIPPDSAFFAILGRGTLFGIPSVVLVFLGVALVLHLFLSHTKLGRTLYAIGTNPAAARVSGFATRPISVAVYGLTALIAYGSGLLLAASSSSINARLYNSTMIYDILLIVVLGGIGLNGGQGRVRNVLLGALLVGLLLNGMTILNVNYTAQNLVKGMVLLLAIIADSVLNPRDEQTSKQGDL